MQTGDTTKLRATDAGQHPVGKRLSQEREARGLSQTAAARGLHVNNSTLSDIEGGKTWPDLAFLLNASRYYSRPLSYFCEPDEGIWGDLSDGLDMRLLDEIREQPLDWQRGVADHLLPALLRFQDVIKITSSPDR